MIITAGRLAGQPCWSKPWTTFSARTALAVLAGQFGVRTAELVAAVTNPGWEPGRDEHEQYREHVLASLAASPWARVIKASDFTDNAVGIIHLTGRSSPSSPANTARWYRPCAS